MVARMRRNCAAGQGPASVARTRSLGDAELPDAADLCSVVLQRTGQDRGLIAFYRELQRELGGADAGHEQLPAAIAATLLKAGGTQVPVGNGRAAAITAALAYDAGFTVAYTKGELPTAAMPGYTALKPIAERCLGQTEPSLGLCYSTGYVFGARAVGDKPADKP